MINRSAAVPAPPVGVIEAISQGFEATAGKLWLVLLPLLLDLLLWFGPRVMLRPAVESIAHGYIAIWETVMAQEGVSEDMQAMFDETVSEYEAALEALPGVQYFPVSLMPSVVAAREAAEAAPLPALAPPVWEVHSAWVMVGVLGLGFVLGIALGSAYVLIIAEGLAPSGAPPGRVVLRYPLILIQLLILAAAGPLLALVIFLPFWLVGALLTLILAPLGAAVMIIGLMLLLWLAVFGVFTVHSMLLHRQHLLAALWDSIRVVQWNMSATMFLLLLVVVINGAMRLLWFTAEASSWLTLIAVLGNAFISTGLIASTFVFYQDRHRYWREMRAKILGDIERRRAQQSEEA